MAESDPHADRVSEVVRRASGDDRRSRMTPEVELEWLGFALSGQEQPGGGVLGLFGVGEVEGGEELVEGFVVLGGDLDAC